MRRKLYASACPFVYSDDLLRGRPPLKSPRFDGSDDDDNDDDNDDDDGEKIPKSDVDKMIREAVAAEVKGLKANSKKLKAEKEAAEEALKAFEGIDPEKVRALLEQVEGDEETQLLKDGKIEEVVAKRTERLVTAKDKEIEARDKRISELETENSDLNDRLQKKIVDGALRDAATKAGVVPTAIDDAVYRGSRVFVVGDDDTPIAKDGEDTLFGKDGKTPLTPLEYMEGMKETAPHWFPTSSGGGANGAKGGSDKTPNPFDRKAGTWNLTEQALLKKSDPAKYERLKAAAGDQQAA